MTKTAADTLEAMAATFRERNKVYGDNYVRLGNAMHALFPEGLTVNTSDDWVRLYFFFLQQVKTSRYATNFTTGGHPDSVHDAAVYAAMLETFDDRIAAAKIVAAASHGQMGASDSLAARNAPGSAAANVRKHSQRGR